MNIKLKNKDGILRVYTRFEFKDKCKAVPSAKWNKHDKCWEYPESAILDIVEVFGEDNIKFYGGTRQLLETWRSKIRKLKDLKNGRGVRPHPFLMKHQRIAREIAEYFPRFAYFMDTGTGKTLTSLQIIQDKGCKFLVICPKSIIKTAWVGDQRQFFPDMKLLPLSRNMSKADYQELAKAWKLDIPRRTRKDELKKLLADNAQVYVINPESFKIDLEFIKTLGINGLVLDESTMIKNAQSQTSKTIYDFSNDLEYVYILSGKPAPNNTLDYFGQMRVVDESILGRSFYGFRLRYFNQAGYMGYDWVEKPNASKEIAERISRASIFVRKEDCLDLPEKTYLKRMIELPSKARKYYREMEYDRFLQLEDTSVVAVNKLASIMKLRQITSGFVLSEDSRPALLHKEKLKELEAVLDEIGDKQVIIWINFKFEVEAIRKMLTDKGKSCVTAYSGTKDVDEAIELFKNGKVQYMIAHPQTLKYGVTFTNCTYAIYYSLSYSFEDYYQSHDRIYRKGQTKPCTFIFLLAENTIDEVLYKVIKDKGNTAKLMEELIRGR